MRSEHGYVEYPMTDPPTDRHTLLDLAEAYYRKHADRAGANLHIVLEDNNFEHGHVGWCLERCIRDEDYEGATIAAGLLYLPERAVDQLVRDLHDRLWPWRQNRSTPPGTVIV